MLKRLFLIFAAATFTSMANAQDFFHRPSPLAGRSLLTLSLFDEVRTELKMSPDDNKKTEDLVAKLGEDIQTAVQGGGGDPSSMRTEIDKVNAKYDEEVLKALSPDQGKRLKQLFLQYNGMTSLTQGWFQKDLALTDDQIGKVKKLQESQWQKVMEAFQGGGSEVGEVMKKNQEEFKTEGAKILTEDQVKKEKDMEGAKFEFKKAEG